LVYLLALRKLDEQGSLSGKGIGVLDCDGKRNACETSLAEACGICDGRKWKFENYHVFVGVLSNVYISLGK